MQNLEKMLKFMWKVRFPLFLRFPGPPSPTLQKPNEFQYILGVKSGKFVEIAKIGGNGQKSWNLAENHQIIGILGEFS